MRDPSADRHRVHAERRADLPRVRAGPIDDRRENPPRRLTDSVARPVELGEHARDMLRGQEQLIRKPFVEPQRRGVGRRERFVERQGRARLFAD
ncbi:transcriptional regulator, MarR family domain protein [Burkholderia pseudomallei MSHR2990]|nr:transcriptional regulator, MarR family domain protein [Burkholderia pseudomallei MSHR2990]